MVRIQRRVSRKRYFGSKQVYEYERMSLDIPRKFHSKVKPFLKQDLNMDLSIKGSYLVITLTPQKRFGTPNTPRKNQPLKGFKHLNFNTKMQILLKCLPAEKLFARGVSARRNVLPRVSPHKNMSINVNSNFRASFLDRAMVFSVWRRARGTVEDSQFSRAEKPNSTAPSSKL